MCRFIVCNCKCTETNVPCVAVATPLSIVNDIQPPSFYAHL